MVLAAKPGAGPALERYLVDDAQFLLLLLKELRKRDKVKEGGLE